MILRLDGKGALYEQLARALKVEILEARYAAGSLLPATRMLAATLGVSRNTVIAAYELLCAETLAVAQPGSGTRVSKAAPARRASVSSKAIAPQSRYSARTRQLGSVTLAGNKAGWRYDLRLGVPLVRPQLLISWRRKQVAAAARVETRYPPGGGLPSLRKAIADYLLRRRGVACSPEDIIVVSGTQQAMTITARVLVDEGESVVIEDPHYECVQHALFALGARLTAVRVDTNGLVTTELPTRSPRLIVVTPSHQFPSGVVMSLERRIELLKYAANHKCWIFEDDYDGEFHYDSRPIPALRSLDVGRRVIYAGTFSKTLFPGIRLGYIVCPAALRNDIHRAKIYDDLGCSAIEQTALANFLASGQYQKHLRKSLVELHSRRQALLTALSHHLGDYVDEVTSNGGMHVVAWFRRLSYGQFARVLGRAADRGLGIYPIHPYYLTPPAKPGLMLGFAGLSPEQLTAAIALMAECFRESRKVVSGVA